MRIFLIYLAIFFYVTNVYAQKGDTTVNLSTKYITLFKADLSETPNVFFNRIGYLSFSQEEYSILATQSPINLEMVFDIEEKKLIQVKVQDREPKDIYGFIGEDTKKKLENLLLNKLQVLNIRKTYKTDSSYNPKFLKTFYLIMVGEKEKRKVGRRKKRKKDS